MRDHTTLNNTEVFTPSVSQKTFLTIDSKDVQLYLYLRSDYHSFVYQQKSKLKTGVTQFDNTLTCYNKTDEAIGEALGRKDRKKLNSAIGRLTKLGLVVKIPFVGSDNNPRRNLVVLDYGQVDYFEILKDCKKLLESKVAKAPSRSARAKSQIKIINGCLLNELAKPLEDLAEEVKDFGKENKRLAKDVIHDDLGW